MSHAPRKPRTRPHRIRNAGLVLLALCTLPLLGALQMTSAQSSHYLAAQSIGASPIHHLDFGTAGDISDDCFYADLQPPTTMPSAPTNNDLRLTACGTKTTFSLVNDADVAERGFPSGPNNKAPSVRVAYADVNANGIYDLGDFVYLTTSASPQLEGSSGNTVSIRLTMAAGKAAGTLVLISDSDRVSYGAFAASIAGSWAWHDGDANGVFSEVDSLYFLPGRAPGYAAGNPIPSDAILIRGPAAPSPTTPQPTQGPVLAEATKSVTPTRWLDMGGAGDPMDDCFYAELQTPGGTPSAWDLRLVGCQGKPAFSFVRDADTPETQYAGPNNRAPSVRVAYADVNNNAQRDASDWYYLTTAAAPNLQATNSQGFTIRLSAAYSMAAGTLVKAGDPDYTSYSQVAYSANSSYGWSDDDHSSSLSEGDNVYLIVGVPPGTSAGTAIPPGSILLHAAGASQTTIPSPTTPLTSPPSPTPSPTSTTNSPVHVEARSVSFSVISGAAGQPVDVYGRIRNPSMMDADVDLVVDVLHDNVVPFRDNERVLVPAGRDYIFRTQWTPASQGHHLVRAYLELNDDTRPDLQVELGSAEGDSASFWVGPPPASQPLLLVSSDVEDRSAVQEGSSRSIAVDVTAYNQRAENVRLDVFSAQGARAESLTPATSIEKGATVRFYLRLTPDRLAQNQSLGQATTIFRALSDQAISNVETMQVAVHQEPPASLPALGPQLVAVGIATAGALAACFRRRD